jgi:hypothetical protein
MEETIEVACECPKSDMARFSRPSQENEDDRRRPAPPLIMQTMSLTYSITFDVGCNA